ncbi:hypothetical protein GYMLUDRAFT_172673 [Collybiopsis luxurians FD-317 M1]|uniref:Unplaced genomic scaffold GYMLUscaffold_42, whole genome shotgun sequence n=1 Tax=Collybiopsis luxurians FD-317 M1 TaxID=944289 RepID=A0A0D0CQ76_9AGAR|nr:hypothetical protein GYMLUDRAFT_172673 [Collybiopsis luxurians FD-317 M1]
MAAVAVSTGAAAIYYQNSTTGDITGVGVTNAFTEGGQVWTFAPLVPSSEVRSNSPIASAALTSGTINVETHLVFVSPQNVLSEYIYKQATNEWQGGPTCNTCITSEGFAVVPDSEMLYVLVTEASAGATPTWRIGFISAGAPGTISEAVNTGNGWSVAPLSG